MQKYCYLTDKETGLVEIGVGCSDEYYKEIGMKLRDVKQSEVDNEWYLIDKCPIKPEPTAKERKEAFLKDFFKVAGYGYYRRTPKGYQSAIESINTADRMCAKHNGLPADTLIFYQEPDFNNASQCTEEWLTGHQIKLPSMTVAEFDTLYNVFVTTWNKQEH